jgi:hypothetical protein
MRIKALQLTPNSWPRPGPGGILAAAAQPQRWRSALFGAAERRSVSRRESDGRAEGIWGGHRRSLFLPLASLFHSPR